MLVSFIIAITVITQAKSDHGAFNAIGAIGGLDRFGLALVVGLTSGYLTSVLRDTVAIIERQRRP
jgi:hypothetical protein